MDRIAFHADDVVQDGFLKIKVEIYICHGRFSHTIAEVLRQYNFEDSSMLSILIISKEICIGFDGIIGRDYSELNT